MEHEFTPVIREILGKHFGEKADEVFERSYLIRYLNYKTKSANRGSKSRASFANHYAIYVLVEDYIAKGFPEAEDAYEDYGGAVYTNLFIRMRQLPFGQKLQNHALNNRMNGEFEKLFPDVEYQPILRDVKKQRYWINDNLLKIKIDDTSLNIANAIIEIIGAYVEAKKSAFDQFMIFASELAGGKNETEVIDFIYKQIQPNVDARLFEIVSYAILKAHYADTVLYWGWTPEALNTENLALYKTGRTNANDGGIDFVMKPLGRFFQVTETLDFKKYFLDIDKIQHYPITFVVKTDMDEHEIYEQLKTNARAAYSIKAVVKRYMESIEEIINTKKLMEIFSEQKEKGKVREIMKEIIIQSRLEFNYD